MVHRSGVVEHLGQFRMVFLRRTLKRARMTWSRGSVLFHHARSKSSMAAERSSSITRQVGRSGTRNYKHPRRHVDLSSGRRSCHVATTVHDRHRGWKQFRQDDLTERLAALTGAGPPVVDRTRLLLPRPRRHADRGTRGGQLRPSRRVRLGAAQRSPGRARRTAPRCPCRSTTTRNTIAPIRSAWCRRRAIIVVDGILVLWDRALRERFDLKIFVDTAADIRLIRRLQPRRRRTRPHARTSSSSSTSPRCVRPTSGSSSRASVTPT